MPESHWDEIKDAEDRLAAQDPETLIAYIRFLASRGLLSRHGFHGVTEGPDGPGEDRSGDRWDALHEFMAHSVQDTPALGPTDADMEQVAREMFSALNPQFTPGYENATAYYQVKYRGAARAMLAAYTLTPRKAS